MTGGPIASPCRNVCLLGGDGLCDGCGRTIGEIAGWLSMTAVERALVIDRVAGWSVRRPDPKPQVNPP